MKKVLIEHPDGESRQEASPVTFKKDSSYSWLVCACGFFTQVFILGVLHAFGVFFVEFIKAFNSTRSQAAWVGSLAYGLSMTFGPLCSVLVNRFGCRIVMVLGCCICSVSVLATSFVAELSQMYGSFSLFYGLGTCFSISPVMTMAPDYFDKYITIAVGIITAGSSIGTLIMAPLSQLLIDTIGWRNTFRFFSGTCIFSALCCALVKPPAKKKSPIQKIRQSPARLLMQELKLWKNRVFVVWTMAITCVMFGFYIPYVHLVSYAVTVGVSPEKGSIIVMILGGSTAFGRILFGKVVQSGILNRLHMHQLSMVVTGTGVMLLPLIKSFEGIIAYVLCVGLVDGCYVVLLPVLTATLVGAENAVLAWGFLVGTSSITFTLGPPVAGALYDTFGTYDVAFHCAGIPIIGGALLLFLIPWAQRTSKTNNIIITISDSRIRDDYDFADDLLQEADEQIGTTRSNCSATTLNADDSTQIVDPLDVSPSVLRSGSRQTTKSFKDQSTLTSPGSRVHTSDIHQALSLLHENARLLADILDRKKDEIENERENKLLRDSTKSRSEMIQTTFDDRNPIGAISIMSVPGGFTVRHVHPQRHQESMNQSDSISYQDGLYSPLFPASQTQISGGSSLQSRQFIDPLGVSPNPFLSNTLQVSNSPRCLSPDCRVASPTHPVGTSSITSASTSNSGLKFDSSSHVGHEGLQTFDKTILQGVEIMKDSILATNPQLQSQQLENESVLENAINSNTLIEQMTLIPGVNNLQSSWQQGCKDVESTNYISPTRLTAIPEVVGIPPEVLDTHPEAEIRPQETQQQDIVEHWLDNSPNDPHIFQSEIDTSVETSSVPREEGSSSNISQKSLEKSESSESSPREIDVFTHLFNDHENID